MKRFCAIFGAVLREFFVLSCCNAVKTKRFALFFRCVDISGNFNAVLLSYFVRSRLYTGISVRFCGFLMLFYTVFIPTLGARDFSSAVSGFCQVFIATSFPGLFPLKFQREKPWERG